MNKLSEPYPHPVLDELQALCVKDRAPAYVLVGPDGLLRDWGGFCENYGLTDLSRGRSAADQIDCLAGVLPLGGASMRLSFVELTPDVTADVYFLSRPEGDWVLFVDSTVEARRLERLQQSGNDLALARAKENRLLSELQRSHRNLLAVLDQLRLVTAIIDGEGRVLFLSSLGRQLLAHGGGDPVGRVWTEVFRLLPDDGRELRGAIEAPAARRRRMLVQTRSAEPERRWFEVDVRDDPSDPARHILYLYDVTDVQNLRRQLKGKTQFYGILGRCPEMRRVFGLVQELAGMDTTVLIEGETGTGKELVARAIHEASPRRDKPFVTVNCGGLSDSLINSQLFGHRKGSFTDAVNDQEGVFEAAHGGTIFLDEIGDIPPNTQTRILRVLEQREIVRVGDTRPRPIQIRVLAATHRDLDEQVRRNAFRSDLLYRIRVARVRLPPLRERREDIPPLTESFLETARASTGKRVDGVGADAMRVLMQYAWPGNVRELRNAVEFAVISCRGGTITVRDLPPEVADLRLPRAARLGYEPEGERERILEALRRAGGSRAGAARLLGIGRATLYRRMRVCMLDPRDPQAGGG
ncbi:MAG: sigma-54-dependent Fis family transcriptional regulator [Lentisphaerae bacterium]|nr:sigma-54-dependent Fis family transcriptional regulator [Lentisphaerota bacterium]